MTSNQFDFNSSNFIVFLWKWRKVLLWTFAVSAVLSTIIAFIIPKKYESKVILFPSTTNSISKALLADGRAANQTDILEFGKEQEADQMLQILNSEEIRGAIIKKYDLMNHYGIDANKLFSRTSLNKKLDKNITFKRTRFLSIEISVLDKDPIMAANIANSIADLIDTAKNKMLKDRAMQALKVVENEYLAFRKKVEEKEKKLAFLMEKGVFDYESQSEVLNEQYAVALINGKNTATLKAKLDTLAKYGSEYLSLKTSLEFDHEKLSILESRYQEAKLNATKQVPHKFIVNPAYPAETKKYPIRWLVVLVSTISALLMAILTIIVIETYNKQIKGKQI